MKDKERILMIIVTRIIPGLLLSHRDKTEFAKSYMFENAGLEEGDLVFANTSISPNDFMVGFVERLGSNCVVIREIGSNRLCNYFNESFTKINKERLGFEILEGVQYKTYEKVLKAFSNYSSYTTRFKNILFSENLCIVQSRKAFSDELFFECSFEFNSKTTIKSIGNLLEEKEKTTTTGGAQCQQHQ